MKKKIGMFSTLLILLFPMSSRVTAITLDSNNPEIKVENKSNNDNEIVYSKNKTIQQLVVSLKGESQESVDQYLNLDDRQRIIAFPGGGFGFSNDINNPDIVATYTDNETGETTVMDSRSEDSATIGEIKEVLNKVRNEID